MTSIWQFRARRRKARRRLLLTAIVCAAGSVTVWGVQLLLAVHEAQPTESADLCALNSLPRATVKVATEVKVDHLDVPRVTVDAEIRLPHDWQGAAALLSDPDKAPYRSAMRCLIGVSEGSDLAVTRESRPKVSVSGGQVVVQDKVSADLYQTGFVQLGIVTVESRSDGTWQLSVLATQGLSTSAWRIETSAPAEWLTAAEPYPWPPAEVKLEKLTWTTDAAMAPGSTVAAAVLTPDGRSQFTLDQTTPANMMARAVLDELQTLVLSLGILFTVWYLRRRAREDHVVIASVARDVRRAVWPLVILQVLVAALALASPILDGWKAEIDDWGWCTGRAIYSLGCSSFCWHGGGGSPKLP